MGFEDISLRFLVMTILREDEDSWPFVEPVKEEDAPHYYEYIKVLFSTYS